MHTVSDIPRYWANIHVHPEASYHAGDLEVHNALCRLFGVPENWAADQDRRRGHLFSLIGKAEHEGRLASNTRVDEAFWTQLSSDDQRLARGSYCYLDLRMKLEKGFQHAQASIDNGFSFLPFTVQLRKHVADVEEALRVSLFELDTYFFGELYGVPPGKQVSKEAVQAELDRYFNELMGR